MRYLSITTENGTRYQVNPDRSVKPLPASAPIAMSPDGVALGVSALMTIRSASANAHVSATRDILR